jgi:hypothetical protein
LGRENGPEAGLEGERELERERKREMKSERANRIAEAKPRGRKGATARVTGRELCSFIL